MIRARRRAFSLMELAISLAAIALLLAVLIPGLRAARAAGYRNQCADNHRRLGEIWNAYLLEHEELPVVHDQAGWLWGGVRYSTLDEQPFLDQGRALSRYLAQDSAAGPQVHTIFCCPADAGITDNRLAGVGTGGRTACRSFGTSYRANANLFAPRAAHSNGPERGLRRSEIAVDPARLVLLGDAVWYETLNHTGRAASWHGEQGAGNLLFLDGSVRFVDVGANASEPAVMFSIGGTR